MHTKRKNKITENNNYKNNKIIQKIEDKIKSCNNLRKNRMILEFNDAQSASIKSIAVKNETSIKCTTRFMSGKLLMFAKLSLRSFIYSLVELLYFPEENPIVLQIYDQYEIEKIHCYHILTDTDSTSIRYVIVSNADSTFPKSKTRDILFEIFSKTEIVNRFHKSDDFWMKFNTPKPQDKKVLGLYEVEHLNDQCYVTLVVNPKECFELFKSKEFNNKQKGIKKRSPGMNFENYAERIKPLYDFQSYKKPKVDNKNIVRISVKKGEMTTHTIKKKNFFTAERQKILLSKWYNFTSIWTYIFRRN